MGGGLSGGSAACASGTASGVIARAASAAAGGDGAIGIAPTIAMQAVRQPAGFSTPSGQHGQESPSAIAGMESAQSIPAELVAAESDVTAETTGADSKSWAATRTWISMRKWRDISAEHTPRRRS
jgi:hypothetical protein